MKKNPISLTNKVTFAKDYLNDAEKEWTERLVQATSEDLSYVQFRLPMTISSWLVDPGTGIPVAFGVSTLSLQYTYSTTTYRKLPETAGQITELVVPPDDHRPVWIRTDDGRLRMIPSTITPVTWSPGMESPAPLARILDRLLDDSTAPVRFEKNPAPEPVPAGLTEMLRSLRAPKFPKVAVVSRRKLEKARR